MKLYAPFSLKDFVESISGQTIAGELTLYLPNRLTECFAAEYTYGLSLFRQAIANYEKRKEIPLEKSKAEVPFFRASQSLLVGPEMHVCALRLYETYAACRTEKPDLILTFDYDKLGEHCIFENLSLLKCKYDKEQMIRFFEKQLDTEYDKFFYDDEYSGFAPGSRFFSLLCNACLEIREPLFADLQEWMLAALLPPDDAGYRYNEGHLESFTTTNLPFGFITQISMPDYTIRRDEYTALAGLLKQRGLNPEGFLEGLE